MSKFKPGTSGNPAGRRKNAKTRKTLISESLDSISKERDIDVRKAIVENMVNLSLDGDMIATRLLLERLEPAYKPVSAPIELPRLPVDLFKKAEAILKLAATGELSVDNARELLSGISVLLKAQEQTELASRLEIIEEKLKNE